MAQDADGNKLDVVDGVSFMPWDWRNLGAAFQDGRSENSQSVAARCTFTARRGFDALDGVDYGRVVEGVGDLGINLRAKQFAFHIGASNLAVKGGDDAPLAALPVAGGRLASLKLTVAREYAEDQYAAVSYDVLQRRPELALAWAGETFSERASLSLHLDPVDRACRLRAGVAFPGPEWREDVYDEVTDRVEVPYDDPAARHAVWVEHEARRRQLLAATRVGARLDLGRLVNWAADYVDYRLQHHIPGLVWRLPLSQRLYNLLVPAEDENQERHRIRGWALELAHDFGRPAPAWSSPSLTLSIEPLAFLCVDGGGAAGSSISISSRRQRQQMAAAMAAVDARQVLSEPDAGEVTQLVLHWLAAGPCRAAAAALEREAQELGLLPKRHAVRGDAAPQSYRELVAAQPLLPGDALQQLLSQALAAKRQCGAPGAAGLTSLLAEGPLAVIPRLAAAARPPPPLALRAPHRAAPLPARLLLQQAGVAAPRQAQPAAFVAAQMRHHTTVRGHRLAVYCVAFDRTGRYVVTGADDYLVKIWDARAGLLAASCRGHDQEVTDLAVAADSRLAASASLDRTIRVWSLEAGKLGHPVSVLLGHTAAITLLDFCPHPAAPAALISSSYDGSVRLWDATDSAAEPFVMAVKASVAPAAAAAAAANGLGAAAAGAAGGVGGAAALPRQRQAAAQARQRLEGLTNRQRALVAAASSGGGAAAAAAPGPAAAPGGGRAAAAAAGQAGEEPAPQAAGSGDDEEVWAMGLRGEPQGPGITVMCCAFSPCGTLVAAGGTDCALYIWRWAPQPPQEPQQQPDGGGGASAVGRASSAAPDAAGADGMPADAGGGGGGAAAGGGDAGASLSLPWGAPECVARLTGHKNDVTQIKWSHGGNAIATASRDGTARQEAAAAAHRKRRPPPPLEVNQVSWSSDDSMVLAAASDRTVRSWCAAGGAPLSALSLHGRAVHLVEAHPSDPRLALSAGYDGLTAVWDPRAGEVLRIFDSADTFPLAGRWTDVLPIVDAKWSPDGAQIAASDAAGCLSVYSLGHPEDGAGLARAPFDQFLSSDYSPLGRDLRGWVVDAQEQAPPHLTQGRQALCDYLLHPYGEAVQEAFAARDFGSRRGGGGGGEAGVAARAPPPLQRVRRASGDGGGGARPRRRSSSGGPGRGRGGGGGAARDEPVELPAALVTDPPTVAAAVWLCVDAGQRSEAAFVNAAEAARLRHLRMLDALAHGRASAAALRDAHADDDARGRRGARRRRPLRGRRGSDASDLEPWDLEVEEEADDLADRDADYSGEGGGSGDLEGSGDDSWSSGGSSSGGGSGGGGHAARRRRGRRRRGRRGRGGSSGSDGDGGAGPSRPQRRSLRAQQRREQQRPRRGGAEPGARRLRSSARRGGAEGEEGEGSEEEADLEEAEAALEAARHKRRRERERRETGGRAKRARREGGRYRERYDDASGGSEDSDAGASSGGGSDGSGGGRAARRRGAAQAGGGRRRAAGKGGGRGAGRPAGSYSHLLVTSQQPGVYVPQVGDEVVYLPGGHEAALDTAADKASDRPWLELAAAAAAAGGALRPAEPCSVRAVTYSIKDGHTTATLLLQLSDPASAAAGACAAVEAPPPGTPEYVLLRSRYDAAVARPWAVGDIVQSFISEKDPHQDAASGDEGGGGGGGGEGGGAAAGSRWWRAVVAADALAGSPSPPADPYAAPGLWERYQVRWVLDEERPADVAAAPTGRAPDAGPAAATRLRQQREQEDASLVQEISPWELYPDGTTTPGALSEEPSRLPPPDAGRLEAAARLARRQGRWRLFAATPRADAAWPDEDGRPRPYNREVALPLGLDILQERLGRGYYRSVAAFKADAALLAINAATYNGADSGVALEAAQLASMLHAVADGAAPADALREANELRKAAAEAADEAEEAGEEGGGGGGAAGPGGGALAATAAAEAAAAGAGPWPVPRARRGAGAGAGPAQAVPQMPPGGALASEAFGFLPLQLQQPPGGAAGGGGDAEPPPQLQPLSMEQFQALLSLQAQQQPPGGGGAEGLQQAGGGEPPPPPLQPLSMEQLEMLLAMQPPAGGAAPPPLLPWAGGLPPLEGVPPLEGLPPSGQLPLPGLPLMGGGGGPAAPQPAPPAGPTG
ncbi:MAG: hypothetical protein J3K34DRAFT_520916 [Monoraphidium minutum]|nr:MAG: hypothetical protein J3K34DRAFT_520916 [Monoraphidium minutum]